MYSGAPRTTRRDMGSERDRGTLTRSGGKDRNFPSLTAHKKPDKPLNTVRHPLGGSSLWICCCLPQKVLHLLSKQITRLAPIPDFSASTPQNIPAQTGLTRVLGRARPGGLWGITVQQTDDGVSGARCEVRGCLRSSAAAALRCAALRNLRSLSLPLQPRTLACTDVLGARSWEREGLLVV